MIPMDITTAIFLYLMFSLCSIFILWILFERSSSFKAHSLDEKAIWSCAICTYTYVDSTHDTISACPRCHSLNRKEKQGE